jgi:hypothetical protein
MPDGILEPPMPRPSQPEPLPWSPTTRCVACAYNLHGLSLPTLCPECGVPNAERSIVFRQRRDELIGLVMASASLAGFCLYRALMGRSWLPFVVFALPAISYWYRWTRPRRSVVVMPEFVYALHGPGQTEAVPLEDVAEVKWSLLTGELSLMNADGSYAWTLPAQFLSSTGRTRDVARVLKGVHAQRLRRADSIPTRETASAQPGGP